MYTIYNIQTFLVWFLCIILFHSFSFNKTGVMLSLLGLKMRFWFPVPYFRVESLVEVAEGSLRVVEG